MSIIDRRVTQDLRLNVVLQFPTMAKHMATASI